MSQQQTILSTYRRVKCPVSPVTPIEKRMTRLAVVSESKRSAVKRTPIRSSSRSSTKKENVTNKPSKPLRTARSLFNDDDEESDCGENCPSPPKQKKSERIPIKMPTPLSISIAKNFQRVVEKPIVSLYERAKMQLNASFVDEFVHRDEELREISSYLDTHLKTNKATGLYISGAPGTGKTLCVTHVVTRLQCKYDFTFVNINCMDCRTPNSIYSKIVNGVGIPIAKTPKANLGIIEDKIVTPSKKKATFTIVLLDEVDKLESKSQDVLYTLFDLPRLEESRLILIGIANTLDLTVRTLHRYKTMKTNDIKEIHFQPYSKVQVKGIIEARLKQLANENTSIFDNTSIELCARKVAMHSGDVRKALQICRRAIDLAESEFQKRKVLGLTSDDGQNPGSPRKKTSQEVVKVTVKHIMGVMSEVYGPQLGKHDNKTVLPTQQQLILCSVLLSVKRFKKSELDISKCYEVFSKVCRKKSINFDIGNNSEFLSMCQLLEAEGFLNVKYIKNVPKISLGIDEGEIEDKMTDKLLFKSILSDKSLLPEM